MKTIMNEQVHAKLPPIWIEHLDEASQWLDAYVDGSRGPAAVRAFAATLLRLARLPDIATHAETVETLEEMANIAQALSGSSGSAKAEGLHHLQAAYAVLPSRLIAIQQNIPFQSNATAFSPMLEKALRARHNETLLELLEAQIPHQAGKALPAGESGQTRLRQLRGYFQRGLAGWLREPGNRRHPALMAQVLCKLEQHAPEPEQAKLWWCGQSIAMALARRELQATPPLRRTLFRLDGEIRTALADKPSPTTQRLHHDLLFYCLLTAASNPRTRALHHALTAGVATQQASPTSDKPVPEEVDIPEHLQADMDHARDLLQRMEGISSDSDPLLSESENASSSDPESIPPYVDAEALRQLFSRAGEIKETQFRMEQQGGAVDSGLKRMEGTILTLKAQLERLEGPMEPHTEVIADKPLSRDPRGRLSTTLSDSMDTLRSAQDQLLDLKRESNSLLDHQQHLSSELDQVLVRLRMLPFRHLLPTLREFAARQAANHPAKTVALSVRGETVHLQRSLLEPLEKLLKILIASAISEGIEDSVERSQKGKGKSGRLHLVLAQEKSGLCIQLWDDGHTPNHPEILRKALERGLLEAKSDPSTAAVLQCLSHPAMANETPLVPRTNGLVEAARATRFLGGNLELAANPGGGLQVILKLDTQPSVGEVLLIELQDESYAIRLDDIRGLTRISRKELEALAEHQPLQHIHQDRSYRCVELRHALGVPANDDHATAPHSRPALLVEGPNGPRAILVDRINGRRQALVQPIAPPLNTLPLLAGSTISEQGQVIFVLDLEALDPPRLTTTAEDSKSQPSLH